MEAFQAFVEQHAAFAYPILFFVVLLENAGVPVPGETAVIVSGVLAGRGQDFNLFWVIVVTVVAAVIGDNTGFWLGYRFARPRIRQGRKFLFLTPQMLDLAEGYFHRYGTWTIFFARFIAGLRVVGAMAAGTAGMHWTRFLIANTAGAVAWATTMASLGYFGRHSIEQLHHAIGRGGLIVAASLAVIGGMAYLMHRLRKHRPGLLDRLARREIWQGLLVAALETLCITLLVVLAQGERSTAIDRRITEWLEGAETSVLDRFAAVGAFAGSLPAGLLVAVVVGVVIWKCGRDWREIAALAWSVLASEFLGLLLLWLLRRRLDEGTIGFTSLWPFGFAGLVPLRAAAVLGTAARVIARHGRTARRGSFPVACALILWAGFGVVWNQEQLFTEALLEYAAGGLIVFAGAWWLEGYGPGFGKAVESSQAD